MLTGRINQIGALVGELCPPTSKYLEGDHVYRDASLHAHAERVYTHTAEISSVRQDSLTFDGTQYVMTAYLPRAEDVIEIEMKRNDMSDTAYVFGVRSAGTSPQDCFYLSCAGSSTCPAVCADETVINDVVAPGEEQLITLSRNGFYIGDELKKTFTNNNFVSVCTLCIGGLNEEGEIDARLFRGEIYTLRVYRGNILLHEYVPAVEDGISGMSDLQTGRFFPRSSVSGENVVVSGSPPLEIAPLSECLEECIIYGSSSGVGDYDSTTGKYIIPVVVNGRNLLDKDNVDILERYPDGDGVVTASGTINATRQRSFCMPVEPDTAYTVSVHFTGKVTARVAGYSSYPQVGDECVFVDRTVLSVTPMVNSFVTTADTRYILCYFSYGRGTDELGEVLDNVQLEKGSRPTAPVPFVISRTELSLDAPLMSGESVSAVYPEHEIGICGRYSKVSVETLSQPDRITVKYQV